MQSLSPLSYIFLLAATCAVFGSKNSNNSAASLWANSRLRAAWSKSWQHSNLCLALLCWCKDSRMVQCGFCSFCSCLHQPRCVCRGWVEMFGGAKFPPVPPGAINTMGPIFASNQYFMGRSLTGTLVTAGKPQGWGYVPYEELSHLLFWVAVIGIII